jgi:Integrase core domain
MRIYPRNNQKNAIQFVDYVLSQLPFGVEMIQTDNGAEFQSAFHWHVLDQGINHTYIKPRTPRLNGKVERSHRIDAEEFYRLLDGVVIDDVNVFNARLKEWQDYYNYHRPHGGLNGQTAYERLRKKTQTEAACNRSSSAAHVWSPPSPFSAQTGESQAGRRRRRYGRPAPRALQRAFGAPMASPGRDRRRRDVVGPVLRTVRRPRCGDLTTGHIPSHRHHRARELAPSLCGTTAGGHVRNGAARDRSRHSALRRT